MIEYICGSCGGRVEIMELLVYPSITRYECGKCGKRRDERREITKQVIHFEKTNTINEVTSGDLPGKDIIASAEEVTRRCPVHGEPLKPDDGSHRYFCPKGDRYTLMELLEKKARGLQSGGFLSGYMCEEAE